MLLTALVLSILGIGIVCSEAARFQRTGQRFDFLFYFSLWYLASYVLAPIAIALGGLPYANPLFPAYYSSSGSTAALVSILAAYPLTSWAYNARLAQNLGQRLNPVWRLTPAWAIAGWVLLLLVGVAAVGVFVLRYGGLAFVMANSSAIRSGGSSGGIERDTLGAAVNLFGKFIYFACWIAFALVVVRKKTRTKVGLPLWFALAASTPAALLYSVISGGRGGMLITFVVFYLTICLVHGRMFLGYAALLMPLIGIVVVFGKSVIVPALLYGPEAVIEQYARASASSSTASVGASFVQNFTHPYLSLRVAIDEVGSNVAPNWFTDMPLGVVFYLRVLGIETPVTVTYLNTYLVSGVLDSNVPPGLVASFWYAALAPGIVLGSVAYGFLGRVINDVLRRVAQGTPGLVPLYVLAGFRYGGYIFTGDFRVFLLQNAAFIVLLGITVVVCIRWIRTPRRHAVHLPFTAPSAHRQ